MRQHSTSDSGRNAEKADRCLISRTLHKAQVGRGANKGKGKGNGKGKGKGKCKKALATLRRASARRDLRTFQIHSKNPFRGLHHVLLSSLHHVRC